MIKEEGVKKGEKVREARVSKGKAVREGVKIQDKEGRARGGGHRDWGCSQEWEVVLTALLAPAHQPPPQLPLTLLVAPSPSRLLSLQGNSCRPGEAGREKTSRPARRESLGSGGCLSGLPTSSGLPPLTFVACRLRRFLLVCHVQVRLIPGFGGPPAQR